MDTETNKWEGLEGLNSYFKAVDISCYDNNLWLLAENKDLSFFVIRNTNSAMSEITQLNIHPKNKIMGMFVNDEGLLLWTNHELFLCDPSSGAVIKEKYLNNTWALNEVSVYRNEIYGQINKNGENGLVNVNEIFSGKNTFFPLDIKPACAPLCVSNHDYLLIGRSDAVMMCDINSGNYSKLFSWADVGCASPDLIPSVVERSDGTIYCLDLYAGYLLRISPQIVPERSTIVLATSFNNSILNNIIYQFNQENAQYKVEIKMYAKNDIDRLRTEIIAGNGPDIIDTVSLPLPGEVHGYYENLLPFIEKDEEISQGDFIPSIIAASKMNGALYYIMPSFDVNTVVAKGSIDNRKYSFPGYIAAFSGENTDDIIGGNANEILQKAFPIIQKDVIIDKGNIEAVNKNLLREWLAFCTKAPYLNLSFERISNCLRSVSIATQMGKEISFIGWPGQDSNGSYATPSYMCFAMMSTSKHKEAAWSFMRQVLLPVYQDNVAPFGFPVMTKSFEHLLDKTIEDEDIMFSEQDAEKLRGLVYSLDVVSFYNNSFKELVSAGANDFFSGKCSVTIDVRLK